MYKFLVYFIAIFHFLWGIWIVIGSLLALGGYFAKHPILWIFYGVCFIVNIIYLKVFRFCPLTQLEAYFRKKDKPNSEEMRSFSQFWGKKFFKRNLPKNTISILFIIVLIINLFAIVYWR